MFSAILIRQRAAYCNVISQSEHASSPAHKFELANDVPVPNIRELTRSLCDLPGAGDGQSCGGQSAVHQEVADTNMEDRPSSPVLLAVSVKELTRSYTDLDKLQHNHQEFHKQISTRINSISTHQFCSTLPHRDLNGKKILMNGKNDGKNNNHNGESNGNNNNGKNNNRKNNGKNNGLFKEKSSCTIDSNESFCNPRKIASFQEISGGGNTAGIVLKKRGDVTLIESGGLSPDSAVHNCDSEDHNDLHDSENHLKYLEDSSRFSQASFCYDCHSDLDSDSDSDSDSETWEGYERTSLNKVLCGDGWHGRENDASAAISVSVTKLRASYGDLTAVADGGQSENGLCGHLKVRWTCWPPRGGRWE
ncbi:hypothetical protein FHG87_023705 [Trinorchestia longiramus]|nr:hypothetical protein FHG87_023705 [Trinorchestia longiramus]